MKNTSIPFIASDKLANAVKAAIRATGSAQGKVHIAALSSLLHFEQHQNSTPMADLLNGLPKSQRVNNLAAWATAHFPVRVYQQGGRWLVKLDKAREAEPWQYEAAHATPYWDYKAAPNSTELDLDGLTRWLAKRADPESKVARTAEAQAACAYLTEALAAFIKKQEREAERKQANVARLVEDAAKQAKAA